MSLRPRTVVAFAAACLLAACGDDDGPSGPPATPQAPGFAEAPQPPLPPAASLDEGQGPGMQRPAPLAPALTPGAPRTASGTLPEPVLQACTGPLRFEPQVMLPSDAQHMTGNLRAGDLDGDGQPELYVAEPLRGQISVLRGDERDTISDGLEQPVRTQIVDLDGDGREDLLVADIGVIFPVNEAVGQVVALLADDAGALTPQVILEDVGRVVCAEAADLDGDGDQDVLVCVFGHDAGELLWLEQRAEGTFAPHTLIPAAGTIHAFPFDADGDGDLDVAAAVSQLEESIVLMRNDGDGNFTEDLLYAAPHTWHGTSGIELADLDSDGDTDILATNGDTMDGDLPAGTDPWTVHGIDWFENDGGRFTRHPIAGFWGAYAVRAFDLDRDGDQDLVVSGVQQTELGLDAEPLPAALFVNDGAQQFTRVPVEGAPQMAITLEVADLDGDRRPEIYFGSMDPSGPRRGERLIRITPVLDCD